ncbi:hypothetical protein BLGI_1918 [Brevibacillus laterosporus GI-9]|nr:hypothetical protein BLGI_1918 [Brevibacillus laterosporus GI-9]
MTTSTCFNFSVTWRRALAICPGNHWIVIVHSPTLFTQVLACHAYIF